MDGILTLFKLFHTPKQIEFVNRISNISNSALFQMVNEFEELFKFRYQVKIFSLDPNFFIIDSIVLFH